MLAARLVMRLGIDRTLGIGAGAKAAGGFGMVIAVALGLTSAASLVLPMALYLAGLGMVLAQAMAGAMTLFPERAGAAPPRCSASSSKPRRHCAGRWSAGCSGKTHGRS